MPFAPSVRTSSAPYDFRMLRRSTLMVSGIVRMIRYPFAAAIAARPIPVLPDVGSIMTEPSFNRPFSSASSIIAFAIRSFTLPAGLKYSSFTRTVASSPSSFSMFATSTSGVFPISPNVPLYMFAMTLPFFLPSQLCALLSSPLLCAPSPANAVRSE